MTLISFGRLKFNISMFESANHKEMRRSIRLHKHTTLNLKRLFGKNPKFKDRDRVLIIGANIGYEALLFLDRGAGYVFGLDVMSKNDSMLKHEKYFYHQGDGEKFPFENNFFDVVYSQATGEHVTNLEIFFSESERVCKPGGYIAHISSPLWYSYEGHHKAQLFADEKWIHIGRNVEQVMSYLLEKNNKTKLSDEMINEIQYMLDKKNMNQHESEKYIEATADLTNLNVLQNDFDLSHESISEIPKEVLDRLPTAIAPINLLRFTHIFRAEKNK